MLSRNQNSRRIASGDRESVQGVEVFRVLVEHWIEHNAAHGAEFDKWAKRATDVGLEEVARQISAAATCLRDSLGHLQSAVTHLKPAEKERKHVSE